MPRQFSVAYNIAAPNPLRVAISTPAARAADSGALTLWQVPALEEFRYLVQTHRLEGMSSNDSFIVVRCRAMVTVADIATAEFFQPSDRELAYEVVKGQMPREAAQELGFQKYTFARSRSKKSSVQVQVMARLKGLLDEILAKAGNTKTLGEVGWARVAADYFRLALLPDARRLIIFFDTDERQGGQSIEFDHASLNYIVRLSQGLSSGVLICHASTSSPNMAGARRAPKLEAPRPHDCAQALKSVGLPSAPFVAEAVSRLETMQAESFASIFNETDALSRRLVAHEAEQSIQPGDFDQVSASERYEWSHDVIKRADNLPAELITDEETLRAASSEILLLMRDVLDVSLEQEPSLKKSLQRASEVLGQEYTKTSAIRIGRRLQRVIDEIEGLKEHATAAASQGSAMDLGPTVFQDLDDIRVQAIDFLPRLRDYVNFVKEVDNVPKALVPNEAVLRKIQSDVEEVLSGADFVDDDVVQSLSPDDASMGDLDRVDEMKKLTNVVLVILKRLEDLRPGSMNSLRKASGGSRTKLTSNFVEGMGKGFADQAGKAVVSAAASLLDALGPAWQFFSATAPLLAKLFKG